MGGRIMVNPYWAILEPSHSQNDQPCIILWRAIQAPDFKESRLICIINLTRIPHRQISQSLGLTK
jgi:hypothetical protein